MEMSMNVKTTPIVTQIETMTQDIPGWSPVDQLYTLFNMAYFTTGLEGDIVEIGCWCGRSTSVLGMAARLIGNTKVHCVDLFPEKNDWKLNPDGSHSLEAEIKGRTCTGYKTQTVWKEPYERDIAPLYETHDSVLDVFKETIGKCHIEDLVITHRGDSSLFVQSLARTFRCKLAFIDGDHDYEAVCSDIRNLEKFLVPGGWMCFDDAFSSYDGVSQAIRDCILDDSGFDLCQQMTRKFFVARKANHGATAE
jgi:predicted O-methyltransferase YrrM